MATIRASVDYQLTCECGHSVAADHEHRVGACLLCVCLSPRPVDAEGFALAVDDDTPPPAVTVDVLGDALDLVSAAMDQLLPALRREYDRGTPERDVVERVETQVAAAWASLTLAHRGLGGVR